MSSLPYFLYDVFTETPGGGGPLAVVDCRNFGTIVTNDWMQKTAHNFGFPESTFIFAPDTAGHLARVRIFSVTSELPMAGHPTIGTSIHLFTHEEKIAQKFVVELGVGPTAIEIEQGENTQAYMYQQPVKMRSAKDIGNKKLHDALGISRGINSALPYEYFSAGLEFLIVPLDSQEILNSLQPSQEKLKQLIGDEHGAVYLFAPDESDPQVLHTRMFITDFGNTFEDPATGSAAGALTHYVNTYIPEKLADGKTITIHQGEKLGRPSRIYTSMAENAQGDMVPRVGGCACPTGSGTLEI